MESQVCQVTGGILGPKWNIRSKVEYQVTDGMPAHRVDCQVCRVTGGISVPRGISGHRWNIRPQVEYKVTDGMSDPG